MLADDLAVALRCLDRAFLFCAAFVNANVGLTTVLGQRLLTGHVRDVSEQYPTTSLSASTITSSRTR